MTLNALRLIIGLTAVLGCVHAIAMDAKALEAIDDLVRNEISARHLPGAVVLIGQGEQILYQRAFGTVSFAENAAPVQTDTVFDIASLTKPVATTTAVLQLVEQGKLALDAPAARYWPALAANGKARITVRQLLTHTSGLRPDLLPSIMRKRWRGTAVALDYVVAERPLARLGQSVNYSDLNFVILGELVRRVSGQALDRYTAEHLFVPLGMTDTGFKPGKALWPRIAPVSRHTQSPPQVHDPLAARMGGVAGHAGLYSTAADLGRFARMLIASGQARSASSLLAPDSIAGLSTAQTRPVEGLTRSLGWRIDPPLRHDQKSALVSHYGYTGTALWIDFASASYAIALSNRVVAPGGGDAMPLRKGLVQVLGESLSPL